MGQYGQLGKVVDLFNGKKNGFFIEAGALNGGLCQLNLSKRIIPGEGISNTLVFELRHQWTGLLVEANPFAYRELLEKNRKYVQNISIGARQLTSYTHRILH